MPEVVNCPACGDRTQQELIGHVSLDHWPIRPQPALYRCEACDFVYTVPKLPSRAKADLSTTA